MEDVQILDNVCCGGRVICTCCGCGGPDGN